MRLNAPAKRAKVYEIRGQGPIKRGVLPLPPLCKLCCRRGGGPGQCGWHRGAVAQAGRCRTAVYGRGFQSRPFSRWGQPGQQQGRRFPSLRLSQPQSIRLRLVSGFFADSIQQTHSLRASGVMSIHAASAFGQAFSDSSKSQGRAWTTPPGRAASPAVRVRLAASVQPRTLAANISHNPVNRWVCRAVRRCRSCRDNSLPRCR